MTSFESIENITKITTIIVSIFAAYKTFIEVSSRKKEKLREDYNFAEKFIDNEKLPKIHDYLLERGYWGLSGKQLEASIIRFFLSQKDPLKKLSDYTLGESYLSVSRDNKNEVLKISLKAPLNESKKLKWKKIWIAIRYFFYAFFAFAPLVFISNIKTFDLSIVSTIFIEMLAFCLLAYLELREISMIRAAIRLDGVAPNSVSTCTLEGISNQEHPLFN